jgi:hypothetical protein
MKNFMQKLGYFFGAAGVLTLLCCAMAIIIAITVKFISWIL